MTPHFRVPRSITRSRVLDQFTSGGGDSSSSSIVSRSSEMVELRVAARPCSSDISAAAASFAVVRSWFEEVSEDT